MNLHCPKSAPWDFLRSNMAYVQGFDVVFVFLIHIARGLKNVIIWTEDKEVESEGTKYSMSELY